MFSFSFLLFLFLPYIRTLLPTSKIPFSPYSDLPGRSNFQLRERERERRGRRTRRDQCQITRDVDAPRFPEKFSSFFFSRGNRQQQWRHDLLRLRGGQGD